MTTIVEDVESMKWTQEGFLAAATAAKPPQPKFVTLDQLRSMPRLTRRAYDASRDLWHEKLEYLPFQGRQERIRNELERLVHSQPGRAIGTKRGAFIDGESNAGKSSLVEDFCHDLVRRRIWGDSHRDEEALGPTMLNGSVRVPVLWIDLNPRPTFRSVNEDMRCFYNATKAAGLSLKTRLDEATAHQLAKMVAGWAIACGTEVVVFDDLHFLKNRYADADQTGNFLKHLMTYIPAVFILVGTDLEKNTRLMNEGSALAKLRTQSAHRFKTYTLQPFRNRTDSERAQWLSALKSIEKRLVLATRPRGVLTSRPDYVFDRTNGFIGTLVCFARDAAYRAIHETPDERITLEMLDDLTTDYAAENFDVL